MSIFDDYELGRSDDTLQIESREENQAAVTKMAQQSRHSIEIISRELDPALYDSVDFVDAVKKMILDNRRAKVRIMVFESRAISSRGHRLVTLAENLSSFIDIRNPGVEHKDYNESLFIADTVAYIHRLNAERFEASLNFCDKRRSKMLLNQFDEMWETATPDANLRKIQI